MKDRRDRNLSRRDFLKIAGGSCAALSSLPLLSTLLNLRLTRAAVAAEAATAQSDYKALVCLFLLGGADSFNMLVPYEQDEYDIYATVRGPASTPGGLAIPREELLPIDDPASGRQFGLHPGLGEVQTLYTAGKLAFVANVGSLVAPTDLGSYGAGVNLPIGLFSHSDQQRHWQTAVPQSRSQLTGWGGRMADMLTDDNNSNAAVSMNIALNNINIFQTGDVVIPYVVEQTGGAELLQGYGGTHVFDRVMTRITDGLLEQQYGDLLAKTHATKRRNAIDAAIAFNEAVGGIQLQTQFPATSLGAQLKMVAKTIAARSELGHSRQTFFVTRGGWDHHADLLTLQDFMLPEVGAALTAFDGAMTELGTGDRVTLFSASDFGRTLSSNGNGSDHAWGGNLMVMGGSVRGERIYGEYPESLALGNPLDVGRGRLIPTLSVDEYAADLAMWFGIPNNATLEVVLPNIRNFYASGSPTPPIGFLA